MADPHPIVDKCKVCSTYIIVGNIPDLRRRMHAHEVESHGRIKPSRRDHTDTDTDYR